MDLMTLKIIRGAYRFSSRKPPAPAMATAWSYPMTCTATMVRASHWVGLTLPGMMVEPGSLAGRSSSWRPARGPLPSHLMSLAIL